MQLTGDPPLEHSMGPVEPAHRPLAAALPAQDGDEHLRLARSLVALTEVTVMNPMAGSASSSTPSASTLPQRLVHSAHSLRAHPIASSTDSIRASARTSS